MLDDLRALAEFAQAGSIARAADRLFRTPSAITGKCEQLGTQCSLQPLRPLGKAAASELARLQGNRTSARSVAADGGAD